MKTQPNPFKKGDILLIKTLPGAKKEWYVDFNDDEAEGEEIDNRPFFETKEQAIAWCKEKNLDAFYETARLDDEENFIYMLVEVTTGRVIYEHHNGAVLTNEGIKKALETANGSAS